MIRSSRSWYIKGTDESLLGNYSSLHLNRQDLSDLGSLILITPMEHTLRDHICRFTSDMRHVSHKQPTRKRFFLRLSVTSSVKEEPLKYLQLKELLNF